MKIVAAIGFASATLATTPLAAADVGMISASDPAGVLSALEKAGYTASMDKDSTGDPMIKVDLDGWNTLIYFYECDTATHAGCRSLQFSAGFDRKQPWDAASALAFARKNRFASVSLDDEGDPYVTWDVITDEGIPAKVFLSSMEAFSDTVQSAYEAAFADEQDD